MRIISVNRLPNFRAFNPRRIFRILKILLEALLIVELWLVSWHTPIHIYQTSVAMQLELSVWGPLLAHLDLNRFLRCVGSSVQLTVPKGSVAINRTLMSVHRVERVHSVYSVVHLSKNSASILIVRTVRWVQKTTRIFVMRVLKVLPLRPLLFVQIMDFRIRHDVWIRILVGGKSWLINCYSRRFLSFYLSHFSLEIEKI